ncbi:MAG: TetR/AcrR family transcriptional regulator [Thermodesulfobacteriota bacterium]
MKRSAKHLPAEERRTVTVEALVELAAEQNPNDITTAAIAHRMGLTQGALFRHFPNKAAILQTVMEWVTQRLLSKLEKAALAAPSAIAALEAMFLAHAEFVAEHPGVPRILFGELQRAEKTASKRLVQTLIKQYGERLKRLIEEGKKNGELNAQLDTESAALLFIGSIQGLVMQSLLAGDADFIRHNASGVFAVYCSGIRRKQ